MLRCIPISGITVHKYLMVAMSIIITSVNVTVIESAVYLK